MWNIIGRRQRWLIFSAGMALVAVAALAGNFFFRGSPLNLGIDFTGGTVLNLRMMGEEGRPVSSGDVRNVLHPHGFGEATIQRYGENDLSIRMPPLENEKREAILKDLQKRFQRVELLEADTIGPVIGQELRTQALWALFWASLLIGVYVAFRFEFWYALAALVALYHDALITTGCMALLWREVDTGFVAAILTVMGYSINDTIVIFDRIRENLLHEGKSKKAFAEVVNEALNQTMARSINTGLMVLVMNLALLVFGGATIKNFALTLFIGFTLGAYSSIFVAAPLVTMWKKTK